MGQVHVASVRVDALPEVWTALGRAGFVVTSTDSTAGACDQGARCRRGDRELLIGIDSSGRDPSEILVVIAHPPYSAQPWRWGGDGRFFGDLAAVLDEFAYRA